MDGAEADNQYPPAYVIMKNERVGGLRCSIEGRHVGPAEAAPCADLGGSSKYSNANVED